MQLRNVMELGGGNSWIISLALVNSRIGKGFGWEIGRRGECGARFGDGLQFSLF